MYQTRIFSTLGNLKIQYTASIYKVLCSFIVWKWLATILDAYVQSSQVS